METTAAQARNARDWVGDVLVDTHWLAQHLGDPALRVVEVDVSPARFREGHIPGATLWDIYGVLAPISGVRPAYALLHPVLNFILLFPFLASAIAVTREGGVSWRGTFYPLSELKAGQP